MADDFDATIHWDDCVADVRDHLSVLASDSTAQLEWLEPPPVGMPVDELAQTLWDIWPAWRSGMVGSGAISDEAARAIDDLAEYLVHLRAQPAVWVDDASTLDRPEWARVRRLARTCLWKLPEG